MRARRGPSAAADLVLVEVEQPLPELAAVRLVEVAVAVYVVDEEVAARAQRAQIGAGALLLPVAVVDLAASVEVAALVATRAVRVTDAARAIDGVAREVVRDATDRPRSAVSCHVRA